ncbi:MAG: hypothetical protein ACRELB_16955 [Polyangiaceae bacterium]
MSRAATFVFVAFGSGLAAAMAVLAACNSSGTIVPAADAAADAREEIVFFDGPTPYDSGAHPEASTEAAADAADAGSGDAAAFGFVQFAQVPVGGGEFTAAFYGTPSPPPPGCSYELSDGGPCLVTTCPTHPANDAGPVSLVSAGALTVTGGAFGDSGIDIGPDNLGSYLYNTTGPMFSAGDTLTVSASGATVPAFAPTSIVAPGSVTLTSPAQDSGVLTIPTTQDLAVAWTGGVTGARLILDLSAAFTDGSSASAACSWDASSGAGTIPAGALASLAGGTPQAGRSTAVWHQEAQMPVSAGRWTVVVRAYVSGASVATFQ